MNKKTKKCKDCGNEKLLSEFYKDRKYYSSYCKLCNNKRSREYLKNNPEKRRINKKNWKKNNQDKYLATKKKYYENNRKKYLVANKRWQKTNIEKVRKYFRERYRKRKNILEVRLNNSISASIRDSLKKNNGNKNGRHWEGLVGYTLSDLRIHLEKQFTEGMNWDNYGEWHIDHRIPKSVFNYSSPEHIDFKRCWALDNLQPLWAYDNICKSNELEQSFQPSFKL